MLVVVALLFACSSSQDIEAPTYYTDAKRVIDQRCATCHRAGDVGPFPLTTYAEVLETRTIAAMAVESGRMPPFLPSHDCNDYATDYDLTPDERQLLLDFFAAGAPEGNPKDDTSEGIPDARMDADLVLTLPEPYTPTAEPDDYRCQLIPLDLAAPTYVTGFQVWPDQRSIVHHNITFVIPESARATYEAYDDDEPGPGWTCFGGPQASTGEAAPLTQEELMERLSDPSALAARSPGSLGGWVPGAVQGELPAGTGILLQPGDSLVVQMHYNTMSAAPVADQSQVALKLASEVEYPAISMPVIDLAWPTGLPLLGTPLDIPAGDPAATAEVVIEGDSAWVQRYREQLGAAPGEPIRIHRAGVHMHQLGTDGRIDILREDGAEECVIHYPDWDFAWQGSHGLSDAMVLYPEDAVRMTCQWDNTAANQAIVDGEQLEPRDVSWGEGTMDEMCLGNLYITL